MTNARPGRGRGSKETYPRLKNFPFSFEKKHGRVLKEVRARTLLHAAVAFVTAVLGTLLVGYGGAPERGALQLSQLAILFAASFAVALLLIREIPRSKSPEEQTLAVLRVAGLSLGTIVLSRFFLSFKWSPYLIPLPLLAGVTTIAFGRRFAMIHSWVMTSVVALAVVRWTAIDPRLGGEFLPLLDVSYLFSMGVANTVMILFCQRIENRAALLRAGMVAGLVLFFSAFLGRVLLKYPELEIYYKDYQAASKQRDELTKALKSGQLPNDIQDDYITLRRDAVRSVWQSYVDAFGPSFWGLINGAMTGFLLYELLFGIEALFGVITRLHLIELADLNSPVLKRMNLEAPGTYHHSQMVAALGEAAAERIGADSLLVRVGAYYHDIGKMAKPRYFTENNPYSTEIHGLLKPQLSALVIHAHVKDGIELARSLQLPEQIVSFIPEHHGTTACEFFYRQAVDLARERKLSVPDKTFFRYPGPRPQSKETGIILVADSVEAAARSLRNPSPARIRNLVHEIIIDKLLDHQFDDCPLSLEDLWLIEDTLVTRLTWMHHSRIKYPKKVESLQQERLKKLDRERRQAEEADAS